MIKHHTAQGFINPWLERKDERSILSVMRWMLERRHKENKIINLKHQPIDLGYIHKNKTDPLIIWLGHSAFLLQIDGLNILTDPMLGNRASPAPFIGPERKTPPAIHVGNLPNIDLVLISHNHYDHLDFGTIRKLKNKQSKSKPEFIVPLGVNEWFKRRNFNNVRELDWWEETVFGDWVITAVPAQHNSGRTLGDRDSTLWCGWVLSNGKFKFYFAGDTGYGPFFSEIGHRFGPINLSTIPIGGYEPRWFMQPVHVSPEEAVKIHKDVRSHFSIAMHWGTFKMTDEDMDEPPKLLKLACNDQGVSEDSFITVMPGEIVHLDKIMDESNISQANV